MLTLYIYTHISIRYTNKITCFCYAPIDNMYAVVKGNLSLEHVLFTWANGPSSIANAPINNKLPIVKLNPNLPGLNSTCIT